MVIRGTWQLVIDKHRILRGSSRTSLTVARCPVSDPQCAKSIPWSFCNNELHVTPGNTSLNRLTPYLCTLDEVWKGRALRSHQRTSRRVKSSSTRWRRRPSGRTSTRTSPPHSITKRSRKGTGALQTKPTPHPLDPRRPKTITKEIPASSEGSSTRTC